MADGNKTTRLLMINLYFAMTDAESAHPTQSDPNNQAMFTRFDCVNCLLSGTKLEIVAKAVKLWKMGNTSKAMKGHSSLHKV